MTPQTERCVVTVGWHSCDFQEKHTEIEKPDNVKPVFTWCTLTILTLCPGVAVMSQVHSFRLGYLSGQFGLLRVPLGLWILCSHSAGDTHTHTNTQEHTQRGSLKIMAAQEKVRGNGKGTGRRETQELNERRRFQRSTSWWQVQSEFHLKLAASFAQTLQWDLCTFYTVSAYRAA